MALERAWVLLVAAEHSTYRNPVALGLYGKAKCRGFALESLNRWCGVARGEQTCPGGRIANLYFRFPFNRTLWVVRDLSVGLQRLAVHIWTTFT